MDKQKKQQLKTRAHALKPVVIIGQSGITAPLLAEIDSSLEHHELLKVRVNAGTRGERLEMVDQICGELAAEHVQLVGHVATLFREGPRRLG